MTRRQVVRHLLSGAGAGVALPALAAAHPLRSHRVDSALHPAAEAQGTSAEWKPSILDSHQNETLIALAERIVPGSARAHVNRFIDLALNADSEEHREDFFAALNAMEGEALKRFGKPFKDLAEDQQNEILTAASTAQPSAHEKLRSHDWIAEAANTHTVPPPPTLRDRFDSLKRWVAGAYYSSEVGMKDLGYTGDYYFDSFPGCEHPGGHS
jgi:hypothetical protein